MTAKDDQIAALIVKVDDDTLASRLAACEQCPNRDEDRCGSNRTKLSLHCLSAYSKCPIGEWGRVTEPRRSEYCGPSDNQPDSRRFGFGDVVAMIAGCFGIVPTNRCGCNSRRAWLNRLTPKPIAWLLGKLIVKRPKPQAPKTTIPLVTNHANCNRNHDRPAP